MTVEFPDNIVDLINEKMSGFNETIGLRVVEASPDRLVGELEVAERHEQAYGLVHGGVYSGMIETMCSVGAALNVMPEGKTAVGLENATSFLKACRGGRLRCTVTPLVKGRRSHVWEARVHDDKDRLVATGRVRLLVLDPGAAAAGAKLEMKD